MTKTVTINNTKDVEMINKIAFDQNFDTTVSCGTYMVDARSILGLFCLVGKKVNIIAPDDADPEEFAGMFKKANLE